MQYLAMFVAGYVIAFARNWKLALALSSVLIPITILVTILLQAYHKYGSTSLNAVASAGQLSEEAISSIRTVHAFSNQNTLTSLFKRHIDGSVRAGVVLSRINSINLSLICKRISSSRRVKLCTTSSYNTNAYSCTTVVFVNYAA